jgi:uncharacterized membrane protein YdbT with pleckstrin-like domain
MNKKKLGLGDDEKIVVTLRRHWFHLAVEGIVYIFIFSLLATFVGVGEVYLSTQTGGSMSKPLALGIFVLSFFGLIMWMRFFAAWSDHWLDAWIITDKRVIDIEQKGFFNRQVSSFPLDRIQDVTYDISGIIPMWLHFGNVRIQTASVSKDLIMRQVPFPDLAKERIMNVLPERRI